MLEDSNAYTQWSRAEAVAVPVFLSDEKMNGVAKIKALFKRTDLLFLW